MNSLIVDAIRQFGAFGVALLMLLENIFPPLPSEVIMPLAGFLASTGDLHFLAVVLGGTTGSVAGAAFWFYVGMKIDPDRLREWIGRHGAFLAMTQGDLDRAGEWFRRSGAASVFFGRLIPVVRTLISVPAGVTRMSPLRFGLYTFLGTGIWTTALAAGGWLLGSEFGAIEQYLGIITWILLGIAALAYVIRVVRLKRSGAASFFGRDNGTQPTKSPQPDLRGPR